MTFDQPQEQFKGSVAKHFIFVGNKPKGRISKRVFQENKARQIFRKTNISYPLIRTRTFFGKFGQLCFLETPVSRFALLAYYQIFLIFVEVLATPLQFKARLEAVVRRSSSKQVFLKILQISQGNTCVGVSFDKVRITIFTENLYWLLL